MLSKVIYYNDLFLYLRHAYNFENYIYVRYMNKTKLHYDLKSQPHLGRFTIYTADLCTK